MVFRHHVAGAPQEDFGERVTRGLQVLRVHVA